MFGRGNKSVMTINGKTYTGSSVRIDGNNVYVDGKLQEEGMSGVVKIVVDGNIDKLISSSSVTVNGDVKSVDAGNSVNVRGDVHGDVDAGNSVTCDNVGGNIDAGNKVYHI